MNTLRRQEKPRDRIECGVYSTANAKVVDNRCIPTEPDRRARWFVVFARNAVEAVELLLFPAGQDLVRRSAKPPGDTDAGGWRHWGGARTAVAIPGWHLPEQGVLGRQNLRYRA
jgi:hypothetical protein